MLQVACCPGTGLSSLCTGCNLHEAVPVVHAGCHISSGPALMRSRLTSRLPRSATARTALTHISAMSTLHRPTLHQACTMLRKRSPQELGFDWDDVKTTADAAVQALVCGN